MVPETKAEKYDVGEVEADQGLGQMDDVKVNRPNLSVHC